MNMVGDMLWFVVFYTDLPMQTTIKHNMSYTLNPPRRDLVTGT